MDFIELEHKILKFWQDNNIFEKLRKKNRGKKPWSFLDGPITANNPMGVHHAWGRSYKDIFQRFWAMQNRDERYQNGFDCQGLWVEVEVEKELGFKSKKDIEDYGISNFVEKCKERVLKYSKIQTEQSIRLGQWMDWENSYYTMSNANNYAIWHFLKKCHERKMIYQGKDVVPWCLRCGTAISQHEILTEEYKELTHKSIFLKFPILTGLTTNSCQSPNCFDIIKPNEKIFLLAWTTTPWTLPANVAAAVNPKETYVKISVSAPTGQEYFILIKSRLEIIKEEYKIVKEFTGQELLSLNLNYQGPFSDLESSNNIVYKIIGWKDVSGTDGTGVVHIAPGCGQEDFELSKSEKLDVIDPINEEGVYKKEFGFLAGKSVNEVQEIIFENLQNKGLVYKIENFIHRYPTCWRCKSELIFRLVDEWYIAMDKIRKPMMDSARKIKWIPAFGLERELDWLKNMRDWMISKKRYWGLALPIFQCECGNFEVIGGKEEMISKAVSDNNYFILRHTEANHNVLKIISAGDGNIADKSRLTEKGKQDLIKIPKKIKSRINKKIDLIFASDIKRIKEVAEYLSKELNAPIIYDKRLRDINCGIFNGKSVSDHKRFFKQPIEKFYKKPKGAENLTDVKLRMMKAVNDIDRQCKNKNILIISHGDPLWILQGAVRGMENEEILKYPYIKLGELRALPFKPLPYNLSGEIEPHRPYLDNLKIKCLKCDKIIKRIPDVGNPWLDAGIAPYSTLGYFDNARINPEGAASRPCGASADTNANKRGFEKAWIKSAYWKKWFPPELVCESFPGQFRNWFYSIIAMSAVLENKPPTKTIFGYASVKDEKGEEMHKSKGNAIWFDEAVEKIGADIMRWMYARQNPELNMNFGYKTADETRKKLLILFNVFNFFITYVSKKEISALMGEAPKTNNILDKWIISKFNNLIIKAEGGLKKYDIADASALIENFIINDLSTWYLRRSRRRFQPARQNLDANGKPKNKKEKTEAADTLHYILLNLVKIMAPIMPFWSEEIYQNLKNKRHEQSVHLCDWPIAEKKLINKKIENEMAIIRDIASAALNKRTEAKIKVRQPLQKLKVKSSKSKVNKKLLEILKDEINVKEIVFDNKIPQEIELDINITQELKEEGAVREIIRKVQDLRGDASCKPADKIIAFLFCESEDIKKIILKNEKLIKKEVGADSLIIQKNNQLANHKETEIDGIKFWLGIKLTNG